MMRILNMEEENLQLIEGLEGSQAFQKKYVKWLMLLTNPNGQIDQFKLIQNITQRLLSYCSPGSAKTYDINNVYFVIDEIFNNLRLFHNEGDLI